MNVLEMPINLQTALNDGVENGAVAAEWLLRDGMRVCP